MADIKTLTLNGTAYNIKATKANLTTTANAVAYFTNTEGTFGTKSSANGALYATSANGTLNWGTLPVAQGGTGAVSFASKGLLIGNGANAVTAIDPATSGKFLVSNGTANNPSWNSVTTTNLKGLNATVVGERLVLNVSATGIDVVTGISGVEMSDVPDGNEALY